METVIDSRSKHEFSAKKGLERVGRSTFLLGADQRLSGEGVFNGIYYYSLGLRAPCACIPLCIRLVILMFWLRAAIFDRCIMRDVQVAYFKIHTWLPGVDKRNVLFIAEPEDDFFCFIPPSLAAKYEYFVRRIGHFTVIDGGEADGDLVLIQTFLLYHVNQVILMLTSIF